MGDIVLSYRDINPDMVQTVIFRKEELRQVGIMLNETKTIALPPMGHRPTAREKGLLAGVHVTGRGRRELSPWASQWAPTPW